MTGMRQKQKRQFSYENLSVTEIIQHIAKFAAGIFMWIMQEVLKLENLRLRTKRLYLRQWL